MKTYILLPTWSIDEPSKDDRKTRTHRNDIPVPFIKTFRSKKAVEKYLNDFDYPDGIEVYLYKLMLDSVYGKVRKDNYTEQEAADKTRSYRRITFWVVVCDEDPKKPNRIGIVQSSYDVKTGKSSYKYGSYFGGKVWKNTLLFRGFY